MRTSGFLFEFNDYWNVVGGLFMTANVFVYFDTHQSISGLGRKKVMIDSDSIVLGPCASLVVPKTIFDFVGV